MMSHCEQLTALVLAGGLGTRLRSAVADRPKVLAPVGGRPWLATLLDQLHGFGVTRTVLCTGYLGEMVEETCGSDWGGMRLLYSCESSPLGTAGALRLALTKTRGERLLVLNGDSWCRIDLEAFAAWSARRNTPVSLVLAAVEDASRYGRVEVDAGGRVLSFREKEQQARPGLINAGIYLVDRDLVEALPEGVVVSLERELLPRWVDSGLSGFRTTGAFLDIGIPESFRAAAGFLRELVPS